MAQGIAVPAQVTDGGRLKLVKDDEYVQQLVFTALGDGDSENPFQPDLGLGDGMVFQLNDRREQARVKYRIERAFKSLESRLLAKLPASRAISFVETVEGELEVVVRYLNMETEDEGEMFLRRDSTGAFVQAER